MEQKYSLIEKDGSFFLAKNNKIVSTPQGVKVSTRSKELAELLVSDANKTNGNYTSNQSILCYHYSTLDELYLLENGLGERRCYVDEIEQSDEVREQWYNWILGDPFLMFRQPTPVKQAVAHYFLEHLPSELDSLPTHVSMAFQVMINSMGSIMLPHYIYIDIVESENPVEEEIDNFLDDLEDYFFEEVLEGFDRESNKAVIERFVGYVMTDKDVIR